ncbi:MAG: Ig domain-containing protein [bacterium]
MRQKLFILSFFIILVLWIIPFQNSVFGQTSLPTQDVAQNNKAPHIVSVPTPLNIKLGNAFSYQIIAEDQDNDPLYYYLAIAPDFITITSDQGLIASTGSLQSKGLYEIQVIVTDRKGGFDEQLFIINISDQPFYELAFITPNAYSIYSKDNKKIEWQIAPSENLKRFLLSYTSDGIQWNDIQELAVNKTAFEWDTTTLSSGQYYLKLLAEDNNAVLSEVISPRFTVKNDDITSTDLAINVKSPAINAVINNVRPNISLEIFASKDATIDPANINFTIDQKDIKTLADCTLAQTMYSCILKSDLSFTTHDFSILVKDSNNNEKTVDWKVLISKDSGTTATIFTTKNISIGTVILCLGLLMLFIPWFLFYQNNKRKQNVFLQSSSQTKEPEVISPMTSSTAIDAGIPVTVNYTSPQDFMPATEMAESAPIAESTFAPEIGEQSLGESGEFTSSTPEVTSFNESSTPVSSAPSDAMQMPSSYANEEIPAWLKDFEADKPISADGENMDTQVATEGAKVHDDYGIALNTDEEESSNTTSDN